MTYETDLVQVASSLAQLLVCGGPPPSDELPAVNAARLGVRRLCAQVLGDIAPVLPVRVGQGRPGIADLAISPVATLRGLLAMDPPDLTAVDAAHPASDGAPPSTWRALWAATALAADGWSRADPASRPARAEAWSAVADIAAVAEAAALVDQDLVESRRGRRQSRLCDDSWRVGIAAAQVRRVACAGPLPLAEPLRPDGKHLLPLRVRSPAQLPAALTRLAHLVRVAGHLRPESVGMLAGAHARTLVLVAQAIEGNRDGRGARGAIPAGLSDELRTQALALVNVRAALRRVRSISSDDPRPARQMAQIRMTLRAHDDRLSGSHVEPTRRALVEAVRPALMFGPALKDLVEWQVSRGQWYTRAGHGRFEWTVTRPGSEPGAIEAVRAAAADGARLLTQVAALAPPVHRIGRSTRGVLDPLLLRRDRRRNPSPADEPGAPAITHVR